MRHTTKEAERRLEALEDMLHRLSSEELQPQDARKPQHNQERVPFAPGQPKVCEVDLTLMAGWRLEANRGLLEGTRGRTLRTYSFTCV